MKNYQAPDEQGFFGKHGGLYVAETTPRFGKSSAAT